MGVAYASSMRILHAADTGHPSQAWPGGYWCSASWGHAGAEQGPEARSALTACDCASEAGVEAAAFAAVAQGRESLFKLRPA
jgi:hypothetical protein